MAEGYTYTDLDTEKLYRSPESINEEDEEIEDDDILSGIEGRNEKAERPKKKVKKRSATVQMQKKKHD